VIEAFNGKGAIPHAVHQWKQFDDFKDMYVERCDMTAYMRIYMSHAGAGFS
jgi:hypothetical protein